MACAKGSVIANTYQERKGRKMVKQAEAHVEREDEMETALTPVSHQLPAMAEQELSIEQVINRVEKVHEIQRRVMKEGSHYGVIPGTAKPTLLKAGAEVLCLTFKLDPEFEHEKTLDSDGHLTVYSTCTLYHQPTGARIGSGKASCSTKESKYAYRNAARSCPTCGADAIIKGKQEFGGGWLCWAKKGGCGAKFRDSDPGIENQPVGQIPNDRLPDCYNTVIKMADIRAHRAAVLFATGASDVFTQDIEDAEPGLESTVTSKEQPKDWHGALQKDMEAHKTNHEQQESTRPKAEPPGIAFEHLQEEITEFVKQKVNPEITGTHVPQLLVQLTRHPAYKELTDDGEERQIAAFAGFESFDDPKWTEGVARTALGKFRRVLKEKYSRESMLKAQGPTQDVPKKGKGK